MKTYSVNYCVNNRNDEVLYSFDNLEDAISFADNYVKGEEKVPEGVEVNDDDAAAFCIVVYSLDNEVELDDQIPEVEYETEFYWERR